MARDHFERVLAGKLPAPVVANIQRFLTEIRDRKRWTMYLGIAAAPSTNIGRTSNAEVININDLPFRRDASELTTSGVGVSAWAGGEYQYPLGDRLRLRFGAMQPGRNTREASSIRYFYLDTPARAGWRIRIPILACLPTFANAGTAARHTIAISVPVWKSGAGLPGI